jgi:hypothetical protein
VWARNTENHDDYTVTVPNWELAKFSHLKKWIEKGNYTATLSPDGSTLAIQVKVFDPFYLKRIERDSVDMLKDEYRELKNLNNEIKKQVRLFNYYFFGYWNDLKRDAIPRVMGKNYHRDLVGSIESLFHQFKVWGNVDPNSGETSLISVQDWGGVIGEDFADALLWCNSKPILDDCNRVVEPVGEEQEKVVKLTRQWS